MGDAIERKLLDKRVAHRYVKKGRLDEKELHRHLESLPDLAEQAVEVESQFQSSGPGRPNVAPAAPADDDAED
jgi:hypothetical protein